MSELKTAHTRKYERRPSALSEWLGIGDNRFKMYFLFAALLMVLIACVLYAVSV